MSDHEDRIKDILDDAYLNGWADTDGNVDYGSGHWIWQEVEGEYYALQTISTGSKWLFHYPTEGLWEQAKADVRAEYDKLEEPDE